MNDPEMAQKLEAYFVTNLGLDAEYVRSNQPIFTSGRLDSFEVVNLIAFIDQELGKRLNPLDISFEQLDSVEKIIACLKR